MEEEEKGSHIKMNDERRHNLEDLRKVNQEIIEVFEKFIIEIKKIHRNCNISRTVSTVVGALGSGVAVSGIIVATVATGGAAIAAAPILGWVGFGVGMGGAATGLGTEIVNIHISSGFKMKIEELRQRQLRSLNKCREEVDVLTKIIDCGEVNCDFPWKATFSTVKDVGRIVLNSHRAVGLVGKAIKYSKNGGFLAKLPDGANFITKIFRLMSKHPICVGVGGAAIFTAMDVYFLYKSWTSSHELEIELRKIIEKLQAANFALQLLIQDLG